MDYKETLNLPKTDFPMKANLAKREPEMLARWDQMRIYDRMFEAFSDKVVVSALHRLHLLPKFDYIYVLDKGEVADEGTLEDLLERSAAFRELWRHQEEVGSLAG